MLYIANQTILYYTFDLIRSYPTDVEVDGKAVLVQHCNYAVLTRQIFTKLTSVGWLAKKAHQIGRTYNFCTQNFIHDVIQFGKRWRACSRTFRPS